MTARTALKSVSAAVWTTLIVVGVVVAVYVIGRANPIPPPPITTDALGPENSETVDQYTARSAASIAPDGELGEHGDAGGSRWALVSFPHGVTAGAAADAVGSVRISEVVTWLPGESTQTPVTVVQVPAAGDAAAAIARAQRRAADRVEQSTGRAGEGAVDVVDALRGGCACVVGLVVRADLTDLRAIAGRPDVMTVDALPADAVFGSFAVRPVAPRFR